jgi:hypothetical protein
VGGWARACRGLFDCTRIVVRWALPSPPALAPAQCPALPSRPPSPCASESSANTLRFRVVRQHPALPSRPPTLGSTRAPHARAPVPQGCPGLTRTGRVAAGLGAAVPAHAPAPLARARLGPLPPPRPCAGGAALTPWDSRNDTMRVNKRENECCPAIYLSIVYISTCHMPYCKKRSKIS